MNKKYAYMTLLVVAVLIVMAVVSWTRENTPDYVSQPAPVHKSAENAPLGCKGKLVTQADRSVACVDIKG